MIDNFTQRNSARENDKLDSESYDRGGEEYFLQRQTIVPTGYIQRYAYTAGNLEFVGVALPGTATDVAGWQVRKFSYTGGNLDSVLWADGNRQFDNIWDDRDTLVYS